MGKAKKNNKSDAGQDKKSVKITQRFQAMINTFNSKTYCHIHDGVKKKNITFDLDSAKRLSKKLPKILKIMKIEQEKLSEEDRSSSSSSDCSSSDSD